ncbi:MAG: hypothetical protein O2782_18950, partial [bacterium]|nr:hypothetical protein [bacterium]
MTTFGNKYVQLLQDQPDPNNSTTYGGLASVLQRGLMGYAMGQEQKQQEASQGRLTQALQQMQGSPGTVINWNQPTRPDGTGDPTTTYGQRDPDMQGAITTLLGDPNHASLAFDLMSQDLTQRQQAEAAANELVEVPNPNGDGSYILVRAGDRMPGQISALPPAPKAP